VPSSPIKAPLPSTVMDTVMPTDPGEELAALLAAFGFASSFGAFQTSAV
jgi:hypothetical protein